MSPEILSGCPPIRLLNSQPEMGCITVSGRRLYFVRGGSLVTSYSRKRRSVASFVKEAGGVAGLNGAFFSDAMEPYDCMVGPTLSSATSTFVPTFSCDAIRCQGRPLVLVSEHAMRVVPFSARMGEKASSLSELLPGVQDAFLGGAWLVKAGKPQPESVIRTQYASTAMDMRKRAAAGVDVKGRIVLCASDYSIDSARLAKSLVRLGVREAVLLDSGFSTNLVWRGVSLVNGHSFPQRPSRPVPHTLVIIRPPSVAKRPV